VTKFEAYPLRLELPDVIAAHAHTSQANSGNVELSEAPRFHPDLLRRKFHSSNHVRYVGSSGIDAHWLCVFSCCREPPDVPVLRVTGLCCGRESVLELDNNE
jgi:hypothetical protein